MHDNTTTHMKLTEELELYRSLFESAPLGYQSLDANGNLSEINKGWSKLLGYAREEVLGRNFSEFVHPDFRAHFKENFPRFKCTGQIYVVEFKMIRKDGSEIIILFDGRICYEEDGTFQRTHWVMKDITERQGAEHALRECQVRLASMFRAAPTGIGLLADRKIMEVNDRFCEMTGYARDELEGQRARMLYLNDEDFEHVGREKYDRIRKHGTGTVETRWRRKDGEVADVLLSFTPLDPQDMSKGVTFTALDMTRQKQAQQSLEEVNRCLQAEQTALTEKNIVLKGVLEQIDEEKKQTGLQVKVQVDRLVIPVIRRLEEISDDTQKKQLISLRHAIEQITSPFVSKLESRYACLTPREVEISGMIKDGLTSKEIAHALHTSIETVRNQRKNIRKKLGIANDKISLSTFLRSV